MLQARLGFYIGSIDAGSLSWYVLSSRCILSPFVFLLCELHYDIIGQHLNLLNDDFIISEFFRSNLVNMLMFRISIKIVNIRMTNGKYMGKFEVESGALSYLDFYNLPQNCAQIFGYSLITLYLLLNNMCNAHLNINSKYTHVKSLLLL